MSEEAAEATAADESAEAQEMLAEATQSEPEAKPETDWKARAREWEKRAKANQSAARKLKELEDAQKSETERLGEQLTAAQQRALEADKLDVALEKAPEGMSTQQVRKLARRISGSTREEMEADAADLFAEFATARPAVAGTRPVDGLRSGSLPAGDPNQVDPNTWLRRQAGRK